MAHNNTTDQWWSERYSDGPHIMHPIIDVKSNKISDSQVWALNRCVTKSFDLTLHNEM